MKHASETTEDSATRVDWRTRLFDGYVSTGQAARGALDAAPSAVDARRSPFLEWIVRRTLPATSGLAIADLACGHGALVATLRRLGYEDVEGLDVSAEQVALAAAAGIEGVARGDLRAFLAERSGEFDALFLLDALEHFPKDEVLPVLDLCFAALRPGGRLVLHVPNAAGWFGMRARYGDFTHEVAFTDRSLTQVCRAAGFERVACCEDGPVAHGAKSFVRRLLWSTLSLLPRLALLAETGTARHVLTQNLLAVAHRPLEVQ